MRTYATDDKLDVRMIRADALQVGDRIKRSLTDDIFMVTEITASNDKIVKIKGHYLNSVPLASVNLGMPPSEDVMCVTCISTDIDSRAVLIRIQPIGFWSEVITITKRLRWFEDGWDDADITWSSGGQTGTVSSIDTAKHFTQALQHAQSIATTLDSANMDELTKTKGE